MIEVSEMIWKITKTVGDLSVSVEATTKEIATYDKLLKKVFNISGDLLG